MTGDTKSPKRRKAKTTKRKGAKKAQCNKVASSSPTSAKPPALGDVDEPVLEDSQDGNDATLGEWPDRLKAHRHRQHSVAAILDALFGPLDQCKPELWGKRAYCMLVGIIYERLASNEHQIETDELVTLAKILAENRRSDSKAVEVEGKHNPESAKRPTGKLPDNMAAIVRRIYGTNFDPTN